MGEPVTTRHVTDFAAPGKSLRFVSTALGAQSLRLRILDRSQTFIAERRCAAAWQDAVKNPCNMNGDDPRPRSSLRGGGGSKYRTSVPNTVPYSTFWGRELNAGGCRRCGT